MCEQDSVQIHERRRELNLVELANRVRPAAKEVRSNEYLLKFSVAPHEVTVFADSRAIIKGTRDAAVAGSIYAMHVGN
jgi:adenylyltransferase/sulfurtransferase